MNYRETRGAYLNCEKRMYDGVGPYEIPEVRPENIDVEDTEVVGFNYAIGCKHPEDKIVHFYVDDYQFERVWNDPERYLPLLKRFKAVIAPDFSIYVDFPKAVQVFNHYRKMWCSAYWQENGIKVIPAIGWAGEESFEWCFDGMPKNALISISTVGGFGTKANKEAWLIGYKKCLEVLEPSKILLFGKKHTEIEFDGDMVVHDNSNLQRKKLLSKKKEVKQEAGLH